MNFIKGIFKILM